MFHKNMFSNCILPECGFPFCFVTMFCKVERSVNLMKCDLLILSPYSL